MTEKQTILYIAYDSYLEHLRPIHNWAAEREANAGNDTIQGKVGNYANPHAMIGKADGQIFVALTLKQWKELQQRLPGGLEQKT